ncbi:MAG: hydrogen gas-evolving membrane-bound hydrogenase subunit E [Halobacteriales archaeon]|nr:hydrogen gas-evolving membrane-bound hydrogenase subunit E [Halobacteriales archaeon]
MSEPDVPPAFQTVAAVVLLPFLAAALVPLVHRAVGERTAYYAAGVALACFGLVAELQGTPGTASVAWLPSLDVALRFHVDGLAVLIGYLATGIGVLILLYSRGYMHGEPAQPRYYAALLAFLGSMLGVAFAGDLVVLFVFWELTSVSSFVLIGHYQRTRGSRYAARKAMVITVGGGLFMLVGFLLLGSAVGTFDLTAMLADPAAVQARLRSTGRFVPVLALVAVGAAAKAAQVPLHVWLPNAMEAPTPVSAFLHAATMVKAGVYLVGRFRPLLASDEWTMLFVSLGLLTMLVTAVLAVAATDIKALLAYSTASHLGLVTAGFGVLSKVGGETGALHILNHALFKAALFLVAGIVAHEAGTRAIDELSGLRHDLPVTAAVAAIAALSMAGLPPFSGFYSKELLFKAVFGLASDAGGLGWLLPAVAVLASVFTVLYSLRFLALFLGDRPEALGEVHRPPWVMVLPPALLAALTVVVSISPDLAVSTVVGSASAAAGGPASFHVGLPTHLSAPVVMSAVAIAGGLAAFPFVGRLHDGLQRVLAVEPATADWYYDGAVNGLARLSATATPLLMTGRLRTYVSWVLGATSLLALAGYAATDAVLPGFTGLSLGPPAVVVLLVAVGAAVATARAPSHVGGVLTLSILGFMIAIVYIFGNAPDLALTQLVVETLVLVIFLLVLDRLPAFYGEATRLRAARDGVLALAVGATVFVSVLVATAAEPDDAIASFFVENAVPLGGGGNVVNVILVDFRAFDTLGEISVVAIAGLSVLVLVAMHDREVDR